LERKVLYNKLNKKLAQIVEFRFFNRAIKFVDTVQLFQESNLGHTLTKKS